MSDIVIPDEAVEAAAKKLLHTELLWAGLNQKQRLYYLKKARSVLEAALPALRAWRVEIATVYGHQLGYQAAAQEIADLIRKRRDTCVKNSAAWHKYDETLGIAERIGAKP